MIEAVADMAAQFRFPLVVDPVLLSKNGAPLLSPDAMETFKELLTAPRLSAHS